MKLVVILLACMCFVPRATAFSSCPSSEYASYSYRTPSYSPVPNSHAYVVNAAFYSFAYAFETLSKYSEVSNVIGDLQTWLHLVNEYDYPINDDLDYILTSYGSSRVAWFLANDPSIPPDKRALFAEAAYAGSASDQSSDPILYLNSPVTSRATTLS
eukprot:CAMPEP_0114629940 /NCGR_PEP_ID=MMETSP0168-20121206/13623_1 /TAXON_ID=95228 ORGANISM="Vannella sp., Strain DIVA3 517/6/12" /NCGR_SAMPLE_ID=MMETSP0168 /ASSEMBLY_ACC=CAM_ASM_000044 /LENGTH=156 /DNA_ID=CAMNT_0001841425 /DNA_START=31 /DNA_END=498 /DNA_ORIENTATION=+